MAISTDPVLASSSLAAFCQKLSARTSTPGGGSLAAALCAVGAGGVSMALRFTAGEQEIYQAGRAESLDALRDQALELVDRDAVAFARVVESASAGGGEALQEALRGALEVPFEVMETALACLRLAAAGAPAAPAELTADTLCGAHALWAGLENAYLMVRANAERIEDAAYAEDHMGSADAMRKEAARLLVEVRGAHEEARDADGDSRSDPTPQP